MSTPSFEAKKLKIWTDSLKANPDFSMYTDAGNAHVAEMLIDLGQRLQILYCASVRPRLNRRIRCIEEFMAAFIAEPRMADSIVEPRSDINKFNEMRDTAVVESVIHELTKICKPLELPEEMLTMIYESELERHKWFSGEAERIQGKLNS